MIKEAWRPRSRPTRSAWSTSFTGAAEPLAIDPNWNRLWAIVWDGPQGDTPESVDVLDQVHRGLEDDPRLQSLGARAGPGDGLEPHGRGCIATRAAELDGPDGPFRLAGSHPARPTYDDKEIERARKQVIDCLERSLELAPDHLPTYQLLVEVYRGWDDPAGLEAAAERLLAKFPEDLETLTLLANHYVDRNDPAAALPLVQKARTLKPLDESLRELEWTIRIGLARIHALAKHWDEGRDEFTAAEELLPDCRNQYFYLARKVIFEAKAGQAEHERPVPSASPGRAWTSRHHSGSRSRSSRSATA